MLRVCLGVARLKRHKIGLLTRCPGLRDWRLWKDFICAFGSFCCKRNGLILSQMKSCCRRRHCLLSCILLFLWPAWGLGGRNEYGWLRSDGFVRYTCVWENGLELRFSTCHLVLLPFFCGFSWRRDLFLIGRDHFCMLIYTVLPNTTLFRRHASFLREIVRPPDLEKPLSPVPTLGTFCLQDTARVTNPLLSGMNTTQHIQRAPDRRRKELWFAKI